MKKLILVFAAIALTCFGQQPTGKFSVVCSTTSTANCLLQSDASGNTAVTESWVAGSGGVTVNKLVMLDASAPSLVVAATAGGYGVALGTAVAGASVQVAREGAAQCVAGSGGVTAGHLVIWGTGATCVDSGQTSRANISSAVRVIGLARTTAIATALVLVDLSGASFGTQLSTNTASNTDMAGLIALSGANPGVATFTFAKTYTTAPVCVASSATAAHAVWASASTTVLSLSGTTSESVNYVCVGLN